MTLFGGCDEREHRWEDGSKPGDACECGGAVLVESRTGANLKADFEEFWAAWPAGNRVKKQAAAKRWRETRGCRPPLADLLDRLELQKHSPRWRAGVIPDPDTWLNQRRWEDDPAALTWGERRNGSNEPPEWSAAATDRYWAEQRRLAEERYREEHGHGEDVER